MLEKIAKEQNERMMDEDVPKIATGIKKLDGLDFSKRYESAKKTERFT